MLRTALFLFSLWLAAPVQALSVAFINPGHANETYWFTASRCMLAAAQDLGINLRVEYAARNYKLALDHARTLASLPLGESPRLL